MLDQFKKLFKKKDETEMTDEKPVETLTVQIDASDVKAEVEKLQADFEAFKSEANALIAQADAEKEELKKQIEAMQAEKENMVAEAAAKKLQERKAKVEMAIGENDKASKLLAATENMTDEQFEAVVSALAGSMEAEAKSEMFQEVGVSASADASKVGVDPVQKLAANLAAQFK